MNSSKRNFDDLTVISGIGQARQGWLRESLGVRTYRDLAALSVDEIESQFKATKQILSRKTIEKWITEAQEIAIRAEDGAELSHTGMDAEVEEQAHHSAETSESSAQTAQPKEADDGEEAKTITDKDGWREFGSFIVEFQERAVAGQAVEYRMKVHYIDTDTDTYWPGLDQGQYPLWMLEQVSDKISHKLDEEGPKQESSDKPEPAPVTRPPIKMEITRIHSFQPLGAENPVGTGQADQPFEGIMKSNETFALEIHCSLVGEAASGLTKEAAIYRARAYAQDVSTGTSIHLGDTEPGTLIEGKLAYTATLPELSLPPGTYRLLALITLQATSVKPDFVTLPGFTVV